MWVKDASHLLPIPNINTACVKACDFDEDGDTDLFVGGRFITSEYPRAEQSFFLINESQNGNIKFRLDANIFNDKLGMVSDALFTDFDGDGWQDLIVVGEWFDLTFYKNNNGKLVHWTDHGLTATSGFWNSINGADLDNDGDIDYVLGNYGTNSLVRATAEYPAKIYSKDFDNNGSYDFIPTVFFKDKNDQLVETPYHVKGDLIKELNGIRKSFVFYHQMANAPIDSIITKSMQKDALISQINYLNTAILINLGNGKFELKSLPALAQIAPTKGTMIDDLDGDGNVDIVLVGNNYGSELGIGRMDAGFGLLLKGDGKNNFKPMDIATSGWMMRSDSRALARLAHNGTSSLVCTNQNGPIKSYKKSSAEKLIFPQKGETKVIFKDPNGKVVKTNEIYLGNGYLSQSSKSVSVPKTAAQAIFYSIKNAQRTIQIDQ